jgi:hypothetical protein
VNHLSQPTLFGEEPQDESVSATSPAGVWEQDSAKRALDELFSLTFQYRDSKAYHDLLGFVARFRFYAPFNALLVHIQMPGARFVAPPHRWLGDYGRRIKPGAHPLVILRPMGPVMFVFDVSDTEGKRLPPEVEKPFEVRRGRVGIKLGKTIENAQRDGVAIHIARLGSQQGGSIRGVTAPGRFISFREIMIPVRYELELDRGASEESQYASLTHELGHLYCGHLGTPDDGWWPDRRGLGPLVREFEAESVSYMVCTRAGIDCPSEQYLAGYVTKEAQVPPISLECVMKAAGLIETMGRGKMPPRKSSEDEAGE